MHLIRLALLVFGAVRLMSSAKNEVLENIQHSWLDFQPLRDIKLLKEQVNVRVSIQNQNRFDVPVIQLEGTISHNGTQLGRFLSTNQKMLPSGREVIWEIPIKYQTEKALFALQQLTEGSGVAKKPITIKMTARAKVKERLIGFSWTDQIRVI